MSRTIVLENIIERPPAVHDQSAAYKIFHYEFEAAVPQMFVYTDEYIRQSGVVVTDDPVHDARQPTRMLGGRYTVAQLAEFFDEGAQVRLENPQDAKVVYDMISEHLENWAATLRRTGSFDLVVAPERDLMLLSRLADTLYGYAARFFVSERPRGSLARRLDALRGKNSSRLGGGRNRVKPSEDGVSVVEVKPKMRDVSAATDIILNAGGRNKWS